MVFNMERIREPQEVKLISGIIYNKNLKMELALNELEKNFSRIESISKEIPFDFTNYYCDEMGKGLFRFWISFERLIKPDEIIEIKLKTNEIEEMFSIDHKRMINIDPGYVSLSNLVLASTKNYSHRVYLGKKIYAEVTLIYKNKRFNPLEWTYPDYKTELALSFFKSVRDIYLNQLRRKC